MADKAAEILPKLNIDSEAMAEIQRALNEGKEVTVSERNISHNSWTGVGYLLIDPASGAGAYKIGGGADGGLIVIAGLLVMLTAFLFLIPLLASGAGLVFFAFALVVAVSLIAAGIAQIMGNSTLCTAALTLALATVGFMVGVLLPEVMIVQYFWSVLGAGGVAGALVFGNMCGT